MNNTRMRRINTIHFVGIGGIGMSGIAEVMASIWLPKPMRAMPRFCICSP